MWVDALGDGIGREGVARAAHLLVSRLSCFCRAARGFCWVRRVCWPFARFDSLACCLLWSSTLLSPTCALLLLEEPVSTCLPSREEAIANVTLADEALQLEGVGVALTGVQQLLSSLWRYQGKRIPCKAIASRSYLYSAAKRDKQDQYSDAVHVKL
jgi:hypothetical protein